MRIRTTRRGRRQPETPALARHLPPATVSIETGSVAWQIGVPSGPLAGATIANDIVFSAALDGVVQAFALEDGSEVFRYQATAGVNAPLAISGDYLFIPVGGFMIPSSNTVDPPPSATNQLIALKLGGPVQATPEGGATSDATPEGGALSDAAPMSGDDAEQAMDNTAIEAGTPEATPES